MAGWGNYLKDDFNVLDERTKCISTERLLVCNACDLRTGNMCSKKMVVAIQLHRNHFQELQVATPKMVKFIKSTNNML